MPGTYGPTISPASVSTKAPAQKLGSAGPSPGSTGLGLKAKIKFAKGGSTASKRGDGCATKGKTKGRFV